MSCSFDAASESLNAFSTPVDTDVEENVSPATQRGKTIAVNRRSRSCFTPVRSTRSPGLTLGKQVLFPGRGGGAGNSTCFP
ncbi:hypothetical protein, partial [Streptomyces sp. sk2.1]|uniref:hypothetical protein n=1 Tax=Streptomyces sp. sk2.1 TaxID=2478959 RepID=UPI001CA38337